MRNGVTFDDKHSLDDFGLIWNSTEISEPSPQTKLVSVPGRNGSIDMSEVLTGDIRYDDRKIKIGFTIPSLVSNLELNRQILANYLHGKKMKIVFDNDPAYYWYGRCEVGKISVDGATSSFDVEAEADPYKHSVIASDEDWLWDSFNFDTDVINEFREVEVNGTCQITLICTGESQNPIITVSSDMTAILDGSTEVSLVSGANTVYDFILTAGEHIIKFNGNGTASIEYRGGSL